jgi:hypothetical protein
MKTRHEALIEIYSKLPSDKLHKTLLKHINLEIKREAEQTERNRESIAIRAVLAERGLPPSRLPRC